MALIHKEVKAGQRCECSATLSRVAVPPTVDKGILRMSPADLVRLGSVKTIQLRLESYGNLSPEFSFRAIICKYAATPPPSILDITTLPPGVDVILFPACPLEWELPRLSLGWHCFRYTRPWTNFIVQLHGTFEDYWNCFCSKTRSTIRRKEHKLAETFGAVEYRQFRSRDEMAEFYSLARRVKLDEFSRRALGNVIPEERSFFEDMRDRASLDQVRGYIMRVNGEPISYLYCIASGDALLHELSGYDSEFARCSPGVLLQRYALQQLFAERTFSAFDFSSGGGQHKSFFSTDFMKRAHVYFFRKTPRALAIVSFMLGLGYGMDTSRAAIRALHLESGARRLVRWAAARWAA